MSVTGLTYRTPADVRAIPNGTWEQWLRTDTIPFAEFAATSECQTVLRPIMHATQRRLKLPSTARPKRRSTANADLVEQLLTRVRDLPKRETSQLPEVEA